MSEQNQKSPSQNVYNSISHAENTNIYEILTPEYKLKLGKRKWHYIINGDDYKIHWTRLPIANSNHDTNNTHNNNTYTITITPTHIKYIQSSVA